MFQYLSVCAYLQKQIEGEITRKPAKHQQASKMPLLSILYKQSCVSQNRKVDSRNW